LFTITLLLTFTVYGFLSEINEDVDEYIGLYNVCIFRSWITIPCWYNMISIAQDRLSAQNNITIRFLHDVQTVINTQTNLCPTDKSSLYKH